MRKIHSIDTLTSAARPSRSRAPVLATFHVVALLAAAIAPGPAAAAPPAPAYATRDQARQCMADQDRLDGVALQRQRAHEAHAAALAKYEAEGAEISQRQQAVDQNDEAAVSEFNKFVADHNLRADQLNQEALDSRTAADSYNAEALAHNKRCATLLIRPEDLSTLTRERARAASAPAMRSPAATSTPR